MNELVDDALRRGFNEARQITKTHAKTFFFASRFLAKEKRLASYAVYAICRISDHAVDQNTAESARQTLRSIKINLDHAYSELPLKDNVLKAFRETVNKYRIPRDYFDMQEQLNLIKTDAKILYPTVSFSYIATNWGFFGMSIYNFIYNTNNVDCINIKNPSLHNIGFIFMDKSSLYPRDCPLPITKEDIIKQTNIIELSKIVLSAMF